MPGYDPEDEGQVLEIDLTESVWQEANLSPGKHVSYLVDVKNQISKASGKPMMVFTHKVEGHKIADYVVLDPHNVWKLTAYAVALGIGKAGEKIRIPKSQVLGRRVMVDIKLEPFNDRMQPKVAKVFPHPEGPQADDIPF